jgi:hypothetical protein
MVPPRNREQATDDPDEEADQLGAVAPDLTHPQPAQDARAGTGIFKKSIEGYREQGAPPRL